MIDRPRILVTGRNGQLGWELSRTLAPLGTVISVDRSELDLRDAEALRSLIRRERPDWVINPAAYTAVDAAERNPEEAEAINATAPGIMAEECRARGANLIHYSTDYVFDGAGDRPYREADPPAPRSVYGRTKLEGERRILEAASRAWIFRTSWLYASRGRNFLRTMLRLAGQQPRLRVVADQTGSPTPARLVAEATAAFVSAELRRPATPPGLYHLTAAGSTSWHGFAEKIVEWGSERGLCPRVPIDALTTADYPTPARRPAWSVLDCGLLAERTGIALPDWQEGLRLCLDELCRDA